MTDYEDIEEQENERLGELTNYGLSDPNTERLAYSRCVACNAPFYPYWRKEHQRFEDMCNICLAKAFDCGRIIGDDEELTEITDTGETDDY